MAIAGSVVAVENPALGAALMLGALVAMTLALARASGRHGSHCWPAARCACWRSRAPLAAAQFIPTVLLIVLTPALVDMAWQPIYLEFPARRPPIEARQDWQARCADWLARVKYQQTNQTDTGLTYTRTYIPGFAIVVAILLFPIGLLKSHPVARVKPATVPGGHTYAPGGLAPRGPAPDARSFIAV